MDYVYLGLEGPHDRAVCYRLLRERLGKRARLETVQQVQDSVWAPLLPDRYPPRASFSVEDPVPVPWVMESATHSVALQVCGGLPSLTQRVAEDMKALWSLASALHIGLLVDADEQAAADRHSDVVQSFVDGLETLPWPASPGEVGPGPRRLGCFVSPDNANTGTFEDVLLKCAEIEYGGLYAKADAYIAGVSVVDDLPQKRDREEFTAFAGDKKARCAAVGAVLRPGATVHTSYARNHWVTPDTIARTRLALLDHFLGALLGAPHAPHPS